MKSVVEFRGSIHLLGFFVMGNQLALRCIEGVRISESLLWMSLLELHKHTNIVFLQKYSLSSQNQCWHLLGHG